MVSGQPSIRVVNRGCEVDIQPSFIEAVVLNQKFRSGPLSRASRTLLLHSAQQICRDEFATGEDQGDRRVPTAGSHAPERTGALQHDLSLALLLFLKENPRHLSGPRYLCD